MRLAFFLLAALPVHAGDSLEVRVDRVVHARRGVVVGMSVGVADGDAVVFRGYGRTRRDQEAKPNADTVYEMHFTGPPGMGFGWHVGRDGSRWHNGQTGGYRAFAAINAERKRAVVILSNTANHVPDDLGRKLLAMP